MKSKASNDTPKMQVSNPENPQKKDISYIHFLVDKLCKDNGKKRTQLTPSDKLQIMNFCFEVGVTQGIAHSNKIVKDAIASGELIMKNPVETVNQTTLK